MSEMPAPVAEPTGDPNGLQLPMSRAASPHHLLSLSRTKSD